MSKHHFLGEILLRSGMIYENQLLSALNEQKRSRMRFGEILLKNGWISENELVEGLSEQLNIPFVDLNTFSPDREVLDLVPRTLAEKLHILPLGKTCENKLRVATAEPMDILVVDELRFYTGLGVEFVLATSTGLKINTHRFYDALKTKVIQENNCARNSLIGGILVNAGLITENQVQSALNEQQFTHMRFGEILLKNGWLSERELAEGLGKQLGITVYSTRDFLPERQALSMVPEQRATCLGALPLKLLENGKLRVAVAEPMDVLAIDELRHLTGTELEVWIGIPSELHRHIPLCYRNLRSSETFEDIEVKQTLLGQVLLNAGIISDTDLKTVLDIQKTDNRRLGDILLQKGYLTERELTEGVSRQMKLPTVLLSEFSPAQELLELVPVDFALKHQILPIEESRYGDLILAVSEPLPLEVVEDLSRISGRDCVFRIARPSSLKKEISRYYGQLQNTSDLL